MRLLRLTLIFLMLLLCATTPLAYAETLRKDYLYFMITGNQFVESGQQIGQNFRILIVVRDPCDLRLTVKIAGNKFYDYSDKIDFIFDRTFTVKEANVLCQVMLEITVDNTVYKESFTYTIVENPRPLPPEEKGFVTLAQLKEAIENVKMETMLITTVFALIGIAIAVLGKYLLKLLEFTNPINLIILAFTMGLTIVTLQYWGIYYATVILIAYLVAWHVVKSPFLKMVEVWDLKNRSKKRFGIAVYDIDGKPYLAEQSFIGTLKRIFGHKIPIITDSGIKSEWKENEQELLICKDFYIEKLNEETENPIAKKLAKLFPNLKNKEICYIELADALKYPPHEYVIRTKVFENLAEDYEKTQKELFVAKQVKPYIVAEAMKDIADRIERSKSKVSLIAPKVKTATEEVGEEYGKKTSKA